MHQLSKIKFIAAGASAALKALPPAGAVLVNSRLLTTQRSGPEQFGARENPPV